LDADLGAAHYYFAQLDVDMGRVADAIDRLADRAWKRRAEPAVYAGLVHACRYAGLLDASVAAHEMAARLDPTVSTSVLHTYYHRRDYARALTEVHRSSDPFEARLLGALGRRAEAIEACRREEVRFAAVPMLRAFSTGMRAALEAQPDAVAEALRGFDGTAFRDGEALFYVAEVYGVAGREADALRTLARAVDAGFVCRDAFLHSPYLDAVRSHAAWAPLVTRVEQGQSIAVRAFDQRRGRALLGV
jgi:tetratricopeptide (TPR) repeat protein